MILVFALMPEIGARIETRKSLEIVDEMRLVEIAAGESNFRPLDLLAASYKLQRLLKAANTTKQLGGQTNFLAKKRDEAFGTKADEFGNICYCSHVSGVLELLQCEGNSGMARQWPHKMCQKGLFEDMEPDVQVGSAA